MGRAGLRREYKENGQGKVKTGVEREWAGQG